LTGVKVGAAREAGPVKAGPVASRHASSSGVLFLRCRGLLTGDGVRLYMLLPRGGERQSAEGDASCDAS
jgi:hypothetical protein